MQTKGFIIVLGWPDTPVRQVGMWYDAIPRWLKISNNGVYKAGHAACVIADPADNSLHYFDFGRYHTPMKMGRIRSRKNDPELAMKSRLRVDENGDIANIDEILLELDAKEECHGKGRLFATVYKNYDTAKGLQKLERVQAKGAVSYGPFDFGGNNCSRFVNRAIRYGSPDLITRMRLLLPLIGTPTTITNVVIAAHNSIFYTVYRGQIRRHNPSIPLQLANFALPWPGKKRLENPAPLHKLPYSKVEWLDATADFDGTLQPPTKQEKPSDEYRWLSGQGAGVWFALTKEERLAENEYRIRRADPNGMLVFDRVFRAINGVRINPVEELQFVHLCHGNQCKVVQNNKLSVLNFVGDFKN